MSKIVTYSSNNSGGVWWLTDQNWKDLEAAGWHVEWKEGGRWLGALATSATRKGLTLNQAVEEFDRVTGCDSNDEGCPCCGQPHSFYEENDCDESMADAAGVKEEQQ